MLNKSDESCQADDEATEIDFTTPVNDQLPQRGPYWPVGLIDTGICKGEGLLAAHLCLTAPENEGLFLPKRGGRYDGDASRRLVQFQSNGDRRRKSPAGAAASTRCQSAARHEGRHCDC